LFPLRGFFAGGGYHPEPGGRSFLMVREAERKAPPQLVLVLNWLEELKAKMGAKR
jgi:hypothetical protein